jgi:hypothetical protein
MKLNVRKYVVILALSLFSVSASASEDNDRNVENLSPDVRNLLQKEMIALDSAMKELISANAAGDYEKISLIAKQMKDGFILKQNLTEHQKHELHTVLPSNFIKEDQEFHYFAGMLEHAAKKNKSELVVFYYSKMFEACSSCHNSHAKHRFSSFREVSKQNEHHH